VNVVGGIQVQETSVRSLLSLNILRRFEIRYRHPRFQYLRDVMSTDKTSATLKLCISMFEKKMLKEMFRPKRQEMTRI
jgi:hypothetical protein